MGNIKRLLTAERMGQVNHKYKKHNLKLSEENEITEMLDDDFFSTYWDGKQLKKMNWNLDLDEE